MSHQPQETNLTFLYDIGAALGRAIGNACDWVGVRGIASDLVDSTFSNAHRDDDYSSLRETPWYRDDGSPMMYATESFSSSSDEDFFSSTDSSSSDWSSLD